MKIIKTLEELNKLLNKNKDLIIDEDIRIEFQVQKKAIRNVKCRDLFLMNDKEKFDFNGLDFNGLDFNGNNFNGNNFNGLDFNGLDFNGNNFNGWDFNGWNFNGNNFNGLDFNGKKISYYATFICYNSCKCTEIKGRRQNSIHKCLDREIEIMKVGVSKRKNKMKTTKQERKRDIKDVLVYGLVIGLVIGLVAELVTQIIAYFTLNPKFSSFDFWLQLTLLIIVQFVGWYFVYKLNKEISEANKNENNKNKRTEY